MGYPQRPSGMRNISRPDMLESQNTDIQGGNVAAHKKPVETKRSMNVANKAPLNPIKSNIQYFTNDTLLMDTTPGISAEDRSRKMAKKRIGKNLVNNVNAPTETDMSE